MKKTSPPGNPAVIVFLTNPVFIKSKYELIDSTHTPIAKRCSSCEVSVCVGLFLQSTTRYQYKVTSMVALSNSKKGRVTCHLQCASPNSRISYWDISYLNYF